MNTHPLRTRRHPSPASVGAILCTAWSLAFSAAGAHETAYPSQARGVVQVVDRIADRLIFLPEKTGSSPWVLDLQNGTRYMESGKRVSPRSLKGETRAEVFYYTPIFGNRFVAKIVWERDASARPPASTAGDSVVQQSPRTTTGLWTAIHQEFEAVGDFIEENRWERAAEAALEIRDSFNALVQSGPPPRGRMSKLTESIPAITRLAERLRSAASGNNRCRMECSYQRLKRKLRATASLYPPEVVRPPRASETSRFRHSGLQ